MIGCRDRDVNAARELLESLTPHVGPELKGEAAAIGCMVKGFYNAIQCSSVYRLTFILKYDILHRFMMRPDT